MQTTDMFRKIRSLFYGVADLAQDTGFSIERICAAISYSLDPLIPTGADCALIDFPNYANVGDSAIWLGQREYLKQRQASVKYTCDFDSYNRQQMAKSIDEEAVILLQGGGNLGDLYPWHQNLRENVIQDFPNNRIIVLPQSIHFRSADALAQAKRVFEGHKAMTLMVREKQTLQQVETDFNVSTVHCPDMAFFLGAINTKSKPLAALSCLLRTDAEKRESYLPETSTKVLADDWTLDGSDFCAVNAEQNADEQNNRLSSFDQAATQRLERGCKMLAQGRVVVTDRLHGHILCVLMGIPHYVMDNSYGKIRAVYETWTKESRLVHWSESRREAIEKALALADTPTIRKRR